MGHMEKKQGKKSHKSKEEGHIEKKQGKKSRKSKDVGRILRTFKIKKNVEVTDNGKIII